jgi:hypothetical protein
MVTVGTAFPFLAENLVVGERVVATTTDLEAMEHPDRHAVLRAVTEELRRHEYTALSALLPGLGMWAERPIDGSRLRNRSRNVLVRKRIATWEDLGRWAPGELLGLTGVGVTTVDDILALAVHTSLEAPVRLDDEPSGDTAQAAVSRDGAEMLQTVLDWAAREVQADRLKGLLTLPPTVEEAMPDDVRWAWSRLSTMPLTRLAGPGGMSPSPGELAHALLDELSESQRRILVDRVIAAQPVTLRELGAEFGVSRERVRQRQLHLEALVKARMSERRYRPLVWRAWALRRSLGALARIGSRATDAALERSLGEASEEQRELLGGLLLWLAGPYRVRDGWYERADRKVLDVADLLGRADGNGLIALPAAHEWLAEGGVEPAHHDAWLDSCRQVRRLGDVLAAWGTNVVDKCVALLAVHGEPADAATLVDLVGEGHVARGVQTRLFEDPRLMRVNRTQWALREWGLEEYSGIAEGIARRIDAAGGRAPLVAVVQEIAARFGVREGSVRAFAEAPMFVVDGGWVRRRAEDEPFEVDDDISACRGVFRPALHRVSALLDIDAEALRGSGRGIPASVAGALGVTPGRPRSFSYDGGTLAVTWPTTSAARPSLGSVRRLAEAAGADAGDTMRLEFDLDDGTVTAEAVVPDGDASEMLRSLTGLRVGPGDDVVSMVATAVGVDHADVRGRLPARGDTAVAALLPPTADAGICCKQRFSARS